jgi:cell division protein FtsW (lipid II flippase)
MMFHAEYPAQPDRRESGWSVVARWLGWAMVGLFGVLIVLALFVAFTAAAVVGVIIALAMLVLRLGAPKSRGTGELVLEGRRTPEGWVVEAAPRPR